MGRNRRAAPRITVLGALAADLRLQASAPLVAGTSNPVLARELPGGVGHNLATFAGALGAEVTLVSRVGRDATGEGLLARLAAAGLDTRWISRSITQPTARYWAALEPSGELALGLADMAVLDELTPEILQPTMAVPADAWLLECNLPAASIRALLDSPRRPALVALDTVSAAKVLRLSSDLSAVDLLCTNRAEAAALVGEAAPDVLVRLLLAKGARRVVMGLGAAGLIVADQHGDSRLSTLPITVQDVTGAGDAVASGTLCGLLAGLCLTAAARIGRLLAAAVLVGRLAPGKPLAIKDLRELALRLDKDAHADLAQLQP